ncbi:MAG: glycoside hydrolase family 15 protein, partial [Deltaproteobacteria bacterium]|nr:glycoside hydrolase family 15 protein [Deltaproteobacteria bacterium]
TIHSATPINPYDVLNAGGRLKNIEDTGIVDDAVCGFEKDFFNIKAGSEVWFGVLILYNENSDLKEILSTIKVFTQNKRVQDYLGAEMDFWQEFFNSLDTRYRELMDSDNILSTAVVFLKMAQVREENTEVAKPNGQIVASLPPGMWNITWLRDMVYSILALIEIGARKEALDAIRFTLNADVGYYKDYVGVEYQFSVCRYFGDGMEESDSNEDGPNIEFDGAGLFLIAISKYVMKYGMDDIKDYADTVFKGFADVIVSLIDEEGLVKKDSSIWERHLNGKEKHFTYTQITALAGICGAIYLAEEMNAHHKTKIYKDVYKILRENIFNKLVHKDNYFVSSLEEFKMYVGYLDASVVEAINFGLVEPNNIISRKTIDVMKNLKTIGGGYMRNDDGDWYDRQEWVFIDLRIASAMKKIGNEDSANKLIMRIKNYTESNNSQFSELITENGISVAGSIPMIGFGAGAYILATLGESYKRCTLASIDGGLEIGSDNLLEDEAYFKDEGDHALVIGGETSFDTSNDNHIAACSCSIIE